ncbi:MAG: hypothetical protein OEW00_05540 [candidate division Zixibacteria bacterium]|nr:hypothetical protein [candidate division Zixibacteria bacterium]
MRSIVVALAVMTLLLIGNCQKGEKFDAEKERMAVSSVLNDYVESVIAEDLNLYSSCMSHDLGTVYFGAFGEPIYG